MAPEQQVAGLVFGGPFTAQDPQRAQDFLSAYVCGLQDYNAAVREGTDTEAVLEIIADATGESLEAVHASTPIGLRATGALNGEDVQRTIDALASKGLVSAPLQTGDLVNTSYLENIRSCDEIRELARNA
jgi:NitT/TauT family transport system substrate-binding protein